MSPVLRRMLVILALVPCFSLPFTSEALEMSGGVRLERDFLLSFDTDLVPPAELSDTFTNSSTKRTTSSIAAAVSGASSDEGVKSGSSSTHSYSYASPGKRLSLSSLHLGLTYNFLPPTQSSKSTASTKMTTSATTTVTRTSSTTGAASSGKKRKHQISIVVQPSSLRSNLAPGSSQPGRGTPSASVSLTFSGAGTGGFSPTLTTSGGEVLVDCIDGCETEGDKVSEPGALLFLGFGLAGLVAVRRRKQQHPI